MAYIPLPPSRTRQAEEDALGIDIDVLDDLPPTFELARGLRNYGNAIARRLSTPEHWLADAFDGDPEYGFDLRGALNRAWTMDELSKAESRCESECLKDERTVSAAVTLTHSMATSELLVDIILEWAEGPFELVLKITELGVELLQPE